MKINNLTVGADPELFIINENTGKVVSSIGLIPGKKGNPWTEGLEPGYGLETDNILAEFNIPPAINRNQFVNSINKMKSFIDSFVKAKNPELGILCAASMEVDEDQLQSDQAKEFGCDVDFNAYTESPNPKPEGTKTNIRSSGMHLHIGYKNFNIDTSLLLIKYFDMYLGLPSVFYDPDTKRRSLYGKAGCFRLTPYGFEYRTLSSAMMKDTPTLNMIWSQMIKAICAYEKQYTLISPEVVQDVINNSDVEKAKKLISMYNIL